MLTYLQSERARLQAEVSGMEQSNESLKSQLAHSKEREKQHQRERESVEGNDRARVQSLESQNHKLQLDLDDCKRECEGLKHDLKTVMAQLADLRRANAQQQVQGGNGSGSGGGNNNDVNKSESGGGGGGISAVEAQRLMEENSILRRELSSFDLDFFEEIENVKFAHAEAVRKLRMYENAAAGGGGGGGGGGRNDVGGRLGRNF